MRLILHFIDMGISLSRDFYVSSFFITLTSNMNKSYKNAIQCKCHVTNKKLSFCILNSMQTNYTEFLQILKERTKYDWSTCTSEPLLMKSTSGMFRFSAILEQ